MNNKSMALAEHPDGNKYQKIGVIAVSTGLLFSLIALFGAGNTQPVLLFWLSFGSITCGALLYAYPLYKVTPVIKNNGIYQTNITNRGALAWGAGILFTGF